ncbi:MAG: 4-aminobutyrate aminotransferase-like enzyme/Ser/Thr protein kinase RdoA (MazF antagonist), partial [Pirellulaceae bacterium]
QILAMQHVQQHLGVTAAPEIVPTNDGELLSKVADLSTGLEHYVRLLTFLPGKPLALVQPQPPELLWQFGRFVGKLAQCLGHFNHPGAQRELHWDLDRAEAVVTRHLEAVSDPSRRAIIDRMLRQYRRHYQPVANSLRKSALHNDCNDYNVIINHRRSVEGGDDPWQVGVIDFGDMVYSTTVNELAIAAAYVVLDKSDPLRAAAVLIEGFHDALPLEDDELSVLFQLIKMRLCTSVVMSAHQGSLEPDNEYLSITEQAAWAALQQLDAISNDSALREFRVTCGKPTSTKAATQSEIDDLRQRSLSKSLSVSYEKPLHITRASGQYLFDAEGVAYLDMVNNVCHVGHCHPYVVAAAQKQISQLNTNTRYLHENIVRYAERLLDTFPAPLNVCFFVNSGSEASDLALRLARTYTGSRDTVVMEGGYHGNLTSLIEISHYKYAGAGGQGPAPYVQQVCMPDTYRGLYQRDGSTGDNELGAKYANQVRDAVTQLNDRPTFIVESVLSCGGQIVLPDRYLRESYRHIREAGGVCIADEVQVGFGRVGSHMWAFETQDVVPDIVTLGKPIGNGHPLAAVVTTRAIADSFANGMEYFNTFGGNPVSCAIGLAVLDVLEEEQLQQHAYDVGQTLVVELRRLQGKHEVIGDVRGLGLFLGIEFVKDRQTKAPDASTASRIVNQLRHQNILLSTDGPDHNVIKIKPPLPFTIENAKHVAKLMDAALESLPAGIT